MIHQLRNAIHQLSEGINRLPTPLLLFGLLAANYLYFGLNDNEEQTLQLAKQWYQPAWLLDSINLTEFPGTRVIYQYFSGMLLDYFSFEQVAFGGRLLLCLLFAWPLTKLFHLLKISNIEALFLLQLLYFPCQSYFAGEWIFLSFETKQFAYVFIFIAIYAVLTDRFYWAVFLTAIATYFHVLVGGWFFLILMIYLIFNGKKQWSEMLLIAFIYGLLTFPFVFYLGKEILFNTQNIVGDGPAIDWIFCYFRSPHHCGIFKSIGFFMAAHAKGVLLSGTWFLMCLLLFSQLDNPLIQKLNKLNLVIFSLTFLFVLVALFDKNGTLLKFFPFRINALSAFLICLEVAMILKVYALKEENIKGLNTILMFLLIPFLMKPAMVNAMSIYNGSSITAEDELTDFIRGHTKRTDVFLLHEPEKIGGDYDLLAFNRKARRDRFVIYKFTPYGGNKVRDWYERVLAKEKLLEDFDYLTELKKAYRVNYIISTKKIKDKKLKEVYKNERYFLYQIK